MKLHTINTGFFKLDGGAMFGVVPKTIWQKLNTPDSNNLCTWAMRCLLVEIDKRLILIDCGLGNKQEAKFFSHYEPHGDDSLISSIHKAGFSENDISDVFLTHLHFDHCGGAIIRKDEKLIPQFKNATYFSHTNHWQWAIQPNAREKASFLKENILPIQESGQLILLNEPKEIAPGFSFMLMQGHTESMMLPVINYKNETIVYMADLLPSVAHIPLPYVMAYDVRPLQTLTEKEKFLQLAAEKNYILYYEHDNSIEAGRVTKTEKGIKAGENIIISEL